LSSSADPSSGRARHGYHDMMDASSAPVPPARPGAGTPWLASSAGRPRLLLLSAPKRIGRRPTCASQESFRESSPRPARYFRTGQRGTDTHTRDIRHYVPEASEGLWAKTRNANKRRCGISHLILFTTFRPRRGYRWRLRALKESRMRIARFFHPSISVSDEKATLAPGTGE